MALHSYVARLALVVGCLLVQASCKRSPSIPADQPAEALGPVSEAEASYLKAAPSLLAEQKRNLLKQAMQRYRSVVDLRAIEQDLPTDVWSDGGKGRYNDTREKRQMRAADVVLKPVRDALARLAPTVLARSLVVFDGPAGDCGGDCPGVSYYVYRNGNQLLARELQRRGEEGARAVEALPSAGIFTGYSGPIVPVRQLADIIRDPSWVEPPF